jgi:divalent metal cation (Fe/Co/Zn/Cd) transporter
MDLLLRHASFMRSQVGEVPGDMSITTSGAAAALCGEQGHAVVRLSLSEILTASNIQIGKRIALVSISVSALLAIGKIIVGWWAGSTSVVADGIESAGDVLASGIVLFGFIIAARPADQDHPYGHGRYETLTGLLVGVILFMGGGGICYRSLQNVGALHPPPAAYGFIPLLISMLSKGV